MKRFVLGIPQRVATAVLATATTLLLVVVVGLAAPTTASAPPMGPGTGSTALFERVGAADRTARTTATETITEATRGYDDSLVRARGDNERASHGPARDGYATRGAGGAGDDLARAGGGGADDTTRVGRWMGPDEHAAMVDSGQVQVGSGGTTAVANPANAESYMAQAKPGRHYVEFDVPTGSLRPGGTPGWSQIPSPDNVLWGKLAPQRGYPMPQSPVTACNIIHVATKLPSC